LLVSSVAPMKACMMRLLEWEAESPAVTGPRLEARRNPGVAYPFEGQPHPPLARRGSHDGVSRGTIFTVAARARALIIGLRYELLWYLAR